MDLSCLIVEVAGIAQLGGSGTVGQVEGHHAQHSRVDAARRDAGKELLYK